MNLKEIAELVGAELEGDGHTPIEGAAGIKEARSCDITFLANTKYQQLMKDTKAVGIIVPPGVKVPASKIALRHENPSLAFAKIMERFGPEPITYKPGIHPTAVIGKNVKLGSDITIQAYVVIEDDGVIGDKTVICAGTVIGRETKIGSETLIHPRVVIRERVSIGSKCIIHSGTVIGSDGFGYAIVKGIHQKIPQIGTVVIEDDVEIGANVTIDRARFDKTWIKRGTKIDNLVQIAHNVVIGENSIIVAQVGISGSTTIGKNVTFAGQSGAAGHIEIGDDAIIAGRAGVTKSVGKGQIVSGFPAILHSKAQKIQALINRLPKLYEKVADLEKKTK